MPDVPEGVRGLLTGGIVDLDVFADSPVRYHVHSVTGEEHWLELPTDLPLPVALSLMARRDEFDDATSEGEQATTEAWGRLVEAFAAAVAIRNEDWPGTRLITELGQNQMMAWINVVIERLQFQQAQLSLEEYLRRQLEPPKAEAPSDPKDSA